MATTYYAFQTSTGPSGLVRRRVGSESDTLERVRSAPSSVRASDPTHEWVEDGDLIRHFADPGDSKLEAIDEEEAKTLAERYGVEL